MTLAAIEGLSVMSWEKLPRVITRARIADVATTVAVRGTSEMSAISPTQSPAARSRSLLPPQDTDACLRSRRRTRSESTLLDQCLALGPLDLVSEVRDHAEFLLRATCEERNSGDQVDFRVFVQTHSAILTEHT